MLPTFLVIGAYRSGTTSLHRALRAHPDVFVPQRKEPSFFAFDSVPAGNNPARARSVTCLADYERLFEPFAGEAAVGEVSPEYLANPRACERIRARVPDARLIAVLRNPIERAYSDFLMYVADGREPYADFGAALREQEARYRAGLPTGYYVRTGFYARQLRPYVEAFPRERLLVHLYDDLDADPEAVLASMFAFLGVDPSLAQKTLERVNVSGIPRNEAVRTLVRLGGHVSSFLPAAVRRRAKRLVGRWLERPELRDEHRRQLAEVYRNDIRELEQLLDRSLEHWLHDRSP